MALDTMRPTDHRALIAGEWVETGDWAEVTSPYDGSVVGRVPRASDADVDRAVASARAALRRADFPQWQRAEVLDRTAKLLLEHADELARILALEGGKPVATGRIEVQRAYTTLTFSAVEARKLAGEVVPMEAAPAGAGKVGFTLRVPLGVVGAIPPFNFPLNLVAHKVGPALAAGNPVVLKPALNTPLSALRLAELMLEAGLPADWLHVVCGSGSTVGERLVAHPDVNAITFTGSAPVGWGIRAKAPRKKVTLELGSSSPVVVAEDGDWETAADRCAANAYMYAGQTCISVQRILVHERVADAFTERFLAGSAAVRFGDPLDPDVDAGPMIDTANRDRVLSWVDEAVDGGGRLLSGGSVAEDGTLGATVLEQVPTSASLWHDEVFGPVAAIRRIASFEEGLEAANDSPYGLQAGVYTRDVGRALQAARTLEFGGVLVNEVPSFRTDQQPYGGVKESGNTKEGPAYAVRELTEERFVSLQ